MKHPATIIAAIALFAALGGGAFAAVVINGSLIKNHSIASKKLNNAAVKKFTAPAGTILTYDANAVGGSPTPTPIGTVLGDTYGATCTTSGTDANLGVFIQTTDGSWNVDYSYVTDDDGTINQDARKINLPAGSIPSSLTGIDGRSATSEGEGQLDFVQLKPAPGHLIWHETALAGATPACHLLVQGIPEPVVTATHAALRRPANGTARLPLHLTR